MSRMRIGLPPACASPNAWEVIKPKRPPGFAAALPRDMLLRTRRDAMKRLAWVIAGSIVFAWIAAAQAQNTGPSLYPVVQGKTYKFEKIADGVYYATGGFGSNNVVVVNDKDVLIVDTGTTPAAARAFVADIKALTNKPIRYVVNTHWHFDHTDGNSIFGPEVQIIAHDYVRTAIT